MTIQKQISLLNNGIIKWKLTKINQGYQMTRINGQEIECRDLYWWEKVLKFFTPPRDNINK